MNKEKYYKFDKRLYGTLNFNLPRCGKTYYEINKYIKRLQQENKILKENAENNDKVVDKINWNNQLLKKENKKLKDKLSKVETLIINHNCDTGDIYYKYNNKFLKSELKQRILEIVYEEEVSE